MCETSDVCITQLQEKYKNKCYVCYPNLICCDLTESKTTMNKIQLDYIDKLRWNILQYDIYNSNMIQTKIGKVYNIKIIINSHLPKFKIILYTIPNIIRIDNSNMSEYIKNGDIMVLYITFKAMAHYALLTFRNIFINDYSITTVNNTKNNEKSKRLPMRYIKLK